MSNQEALLVLSPFVLPEVRQGIHGMKPQNLTPGLDRLAYLQRTLLDQRNLLRMNVDLAKRYRSTLSHWYLTQWKEDPATGATTVHPLPEAELMISLQVDQLGVLLRDGRSRADDDLAYMPTGTDTGKMLTLLGRLHRGITRSALLSLATELDVGFDDELLDDLIARGAVEVGSREPVAAAAEPMVAWMGHAFVRVEGGGKSVWIDPFPLPRLRWTEAELGTLFDPTLPDAHMLDDYGPGAHHVTQDELPLPDAIFITHPDTDHYDLGALGMLPAHIPIYVPRVQPNAPWDVDLTVALRAVLGDDRDVRVLDHGASVELGPIKITAMPFRGEYPASLPHQWNTYYVELPNQVWALMADGSVTDEHVELLRTRRRGDARPFGMMCNVISADRYSAGYFDTTLDLGSMARLWSWYTAPARLFEEALLPGPTYYELGELAAHAGLSFFFPYAHGNLPWYRVASSYVLRSHIGSHSASQLRSMTRIVQHAGADLVYLRHGQPFRPGVDAERYLAARQPEPGRDSGAGHDRDHSHCGHDHDHSHCGHDHDDRNH
jgi:L-ascorbate metabolism protein UlaG (beta-lactamase superfamily)